MFNPNSIWVTITLLIMLMLLLVKLLYETYNLSITIF